MCVEHSQVKTVVGLSHGDVIFSMSGPQAAEMKNQIIFVWLDFGKKMLVISI
jgi:sarcosine oxidase gamma subunit